MGILNTIKFIMNHPLTEHSKTKALGRWLSWQIGSRLVPGPVVVPFVNDSKLIVSPGMTGATGNIYAGLHEFEDMSFVLHSLTANDLFADVGANIGSYTILASAVVGARCISIEPIPDTFEKLKRNILVNSIQHLVEAYNIGISKEDGIIKFTTGLDTVNHAADKGESLSEDLIEAKVRTLDGLLTGKQPKIVKIDVEGFETNVIAGADRTLSQASLSAVIMELNGSGRRYGFDENALHRTMLDYGFRTFSYAPFQRKLIPLNERTSTSGNTLYIKDLEPVMDRVSTAPKFHVHGRLI
jgi:FkbM family methyltransferase